MSPSRLQTHRYATGNITVNAFNNSSPPTAIPISWIQPQLTLNAAGSISIQTPISGSAGTLALLAGGTITQGSTGTITVANLRALTQNDPGAAITLTNSQNAVSGNVTLSALNTAGTAPAAGAINFFGSTGFTVAAQPGNGLNGQEIGVNTNSSISLRGGDTIRVSGAVGNSNTGFVSLQTSNNDLLINGPITSRTEIDLFADRNIALAAEVTVAAPGTVFLGASGAITQTPA